MWVWVASDAKTKIIAVLQVETCNQEKTYSVVHELKHQLAEGCVPVLVLLGDFVYSQVIKHQRRRRTVEVERERRVLVGEAGQYGERLRLPGMSGRIIITSFVERLNLTIRQCVSKLTRRTWGLAKFTPELMEHFEWWRSYYHFVRPHESLEDELAQPVKGKGKQQPRKYRKRLRR